VDSGTGGGKRLEIGSRDRDRIGLFTTASLYGPKVAARLPAPVASGESGVSHLSGPFIFPRWTNGVRVVVAIVAATLPAYIVLLFAYGASPNATDVGYQPPQPVAYSHALHAGELGTDCRYCHTTVEIAAHAAVPSTKVCLNCHAKIFGQSEKLSLVRQSYADGTPIEWVRVHDLPDYAYFSHSAHVRRGVGCASCHGRVDKMYEAGVYQVEPLSMGWCLQCHREPERHLRPVDEVTNMEYLPPGGDQVSLGERLRRELNLNPPQDCSACHR